jgi:hypothetical protein
VRKAGIAFDSTTNLSGIRSLDVVAETGDGSWRGKVSNRSNKPVGTDGESGPSLMILPRVLDIRLVLGDDM